MSRPKFLRLALPIAGFALAAGCAMDDQTILTSNAVQPVPLFARYVSMGNSITAGYQSGGINDSTQRQSYAVLLAAKANAPFNIPLINKPGCPPPFTAPLGTTGRLSGGTATTCGLRTFQLNTAVQNLAVPGATVGSIFNNVYASNTLTTLILGGETQQQRMQEYKPTFVSAWIGNNDALGAATSGVLGPLAAGADSSLTPLAKFKVRYDTVAAGIKAAGVQGAVLIGVVDAVQAAPLLQPGAYYFLSRDAAGLFNGKAVNNNCSPVTALGTPNPLSANMVSFAIVGDAAFPEINCDPNALPAADPRRGVYLLDTNEQAIVRQRIADYNAYIASVATANGWAYLDPNVLLGQQLAITTTVAGNPLFQGIRKCQLLATATTAAAFQTAVLRSCPVPTTGATAALSAPNFFGSLFTFDGVHPSAAAHVIIANELAKVINAKYGTSLATT
ncbi:MAG TPA: SGNH/GDSL hydrolase family protein [Longimicrobiaceae bacterium]|jgi:hypothetical protein|nr:SGNH/GDSL hydrolase family protein [Longimicrobiaceae bacterium]